LHGFTGTTIFDLQFEQLTVNVVLNACPPSFGETEHDPGNGG
jgi:hypothetical protein